MGHQECCRHREFEIRGEVGGLYQNAPDARVIAVVGCGCITLLSGYKTSGHHLGGIQDNEVLISMRWISN